MCTDSASNIRPNLHHLQHLYRSEKYNEVLGQTQTYNIEKLSETERCRIFVIRGKCFYQLKREVIRTYPKSLRVSYRLRAAASASHCIYRTERHYVRRSEDALIEFKQALNYIPSDSEALYWKGVALFSLRKKKKAYSTFAKAAKCGSTTARQHCVKLFRNYSNLTFIKTRNLTLPQSEVYSNLSSKEPYLRCEALHALRENSHLSGRLQAKVQDLSGIFVFCIYIPSTGDEDSRVRSLAREILFLQESKMA